MKFEKFFAGFKQLSLRRKLIRSELGKNLLTAAEQTLESSEPWKVQDLQDVVEHAPIPAYERAAIESIIDSGTRRKAKEIYHESFTKYMFGNMPLEDVRRNAQTLGKHDRDKAEHAAQIKAQVAQRMASANQQAIEYLKQEAARRNATPGAYVRQPSMFGTIQDSNSVTYEFLQEYFDETK
jgi:hypothetical protein